MVRRMRARLQKFLPVVLIALAMQVLAPIAACWATGIAAGDPLQTAICHSNGASNTAPDDPADAHAGACSICCLVQASASLDTPQATFVTSLRLAAPVVWYATTASVAVSHGGFNAKARAPPHLT
jgi:Protein of unknown function (DUF2946)